MRTAAIVACLLGITLSVAVGPGLSLTRCLLSGEVRLSCCCVDSSPSGSMDVPDQCCEFHHLEQAWSAGLTSDPAALPPPVVQMTVSDLSTAKQLVAAKNCAPAESPPGLLRGLRI